MKLKSKRIIPYRGKVYDLKIKNDPSYNIKNIVVHNSVGGSLCAYALDIIRIDPLQYGLYFERFINPARTASPDIDCDFASGARELVRKHLEEKYGKESVCGVVTFGLYGAKSAIQDISRGLGKDTSFTSTLSMEVSKLEDIEDQKELVNYFADLQTKSTSGTLLKWIRENQDVIHWANKLIGQTKNLGTHAGGILITPGPIYDHIPVTRGGKEVVTAFKEADGSSKDLSELGLLKLDILGLKTLNILQGATDEIKKNLGLDIMNDIQYLDVNNPELYDFVRNKSLAGVFQLEGNTPSSLIKTIQPKSIWDIIAINCINRPGPLETFSPVYHIWKKFYEDGTPDKCKDYDIYPKLDFMLKATEKTYGALLMQEQFMFMVAAAADFNLGEADNFRRAIAWREDNPKFHTVKKYFDQLQEKMLAKGYSQSDVDYFLDYCRKFMGYSFNACLPGSETIYRIGSNKSKRDSSIGELYGLYNGGYKNAKEKNLIPLWKKLRKKGYGFSLSLTEEKTLIKNEIVDIRLVGEMDVHRITTESGKTIDCTLNHKFPTSNGEKKVEDFNIENDFLYVYNGYIQKDCYHLFGKEGDNFPITGQQGFQTKDTDYTRWKNHCERLLATQDFCSTCSNKHKRLELHHIDGNRQNNVEENLTLLCPSCHKKEHYRNHSRVKANEKGLSTKLERIISIEFVKKDIVYDVEMAAPSHTFVNKNKIVTSNSHSAVYSITGLQCVYLKLYYPAYFYAHWANIEAHENLGEIIADAIASGIEVLAPSIAKSKYDFCVEDGKIRIGLKAIKGFGEIAYEELVTLETNKATTIYEILTKPFKKVNSKLFQGLIDVGAFDEFGVERNKVEILRSLYTDKKIAMWFSRKKKALDISNMPESLLHFKENILFSTVQEVKDLPTPHIELITKLIPHVKSRAATENQIVEKEELLLGFSLVTLNKICKLEEVIAQHSELNLKPFSGETKESDLCYWFLIDKVTLRTKKGKPYLSLEISDRKSTAKVKCWDSVDLKKGYAYVSRVKKDKWGISIVCDQYLTQLDLN